MNTNFTDMTDAEAKLQQIAHQLEDTSFLPLDGNDQQLIELIQAEKISKKLKTELRDIKNPSRQEVKMLIQLYWQMQDQRIALRNQTRAIEQNDQAESAKANIIALDWATKNSAIIELGVKEILQIIAESTEVGRWLLKIVGIGPVLAAGCLAYFDVEGKQYSSQFISYAGLNDNNRPFLGRVGAERIMRELLEAAGNPKKVDDEFVMQYATRTQWPYAYLMTRALNVKTKRWSINDLIAAAAKIPYNKELKGLCWKIGQTFNWQINNPNSLYGRLLGERKQLETERNERGEYADQAAAILSSKNIGKETIAYGEYAKGRLPKAHIAARAQRWIEKIFVSHLFEEMYRVRYGKVPPRYYALEKLEGQHNREIEPEVPYFEV